MRETVENAAKGILEFRRRKLYISETKIELSLEKNEVREGSFSVSAKDELPFKAFVYSSSLRMRLDVREFEGASGEIGYRFDSAGMDEGEVHNGEIHIVAASGEYRVPFSAAVSYPVLESGVGPVRNLFHFTNLAQSDWQEAVELFYRPEFIRIFTGSDRQYLECYRGLVAGTDRGQSVEEFLISIRKKEAVRFRAETQEIVIDAPEQDSVQDIILTKSGWGHVQIDVGTDGAFLKPTKETLTAEDFQENLMHFRYEIEPSALHAGKNYGAFVFSGLYGEETVRITVRAKGRPEAIKERKRQERELAVRLAGFYGDFRTRRLSLSKWVKQSQELAEEWTSLEEREPLPRLIQAQLLLAEQRRNEAGWILEHTYKELDLSGRDPRIYAYYLYLTALARMDEEYTDKVTGRIRDIYEEHPDFSILWMLFYLDEELSFNLSRKFSLLEEKFKEGCHSVLLYSEAYALAVQEPALLTKLGPFEIQTLNWALKREQADRETVGRVVELCASHKGYHPLLAKLLEGYYGYFPEEDLVHAVCSLLIRANRTDRESFWWYELGVELGLRITRLYEYYMMSVPLDRREALPKTVLMYFAYASHLDYVRNAYLYAGVLRNREEYPGIAASYEQHIREFAGDQVKKRHINADLAYLYENVLKPGEMPEETEEGLCELALTARIPVEDGRIREIAVIHGQLVGEETFPVENGEAYVRLYGGDYRLFALYGRGRRLFYSVRLEPEILFEDGEYAARLGRKAKGGVGLSLRLCLSGGSYTALSAGNDACFLRLFESEQVVREYRNEIWECLLHFYYEADRIDEVDMLLSRADPAVMNTAQRAELVEHMVIRGMAEEAYGSILKYGTERISPKVLVRILSRVLKKRGREPDRDLLSLCFSVFSRGKYDEEMLIYLAGCYEGRVRELRDIWKAAAAFGLETPGLLERLIIQMLFTGEFVGEKEDIFEAYMGGMPDERIKLAYLTYEAYGYFVMDEAVDERFFPLLLDECGRGVRLNDACKLAVLKYYSERDREDRQEEAELLLGFLGELLRKNIFFKFFLKYRDSLPRLDGYRDKTMVEYRAMPHSRVAIHYILDRGEKGDGRYVQEEMRNVFGGVFVKEFILFFGEELQYYITEKTDGEERLTESRTVSNNDVGQDGSGDRYSLLNDMAVGQTLQDEESLLALMEKYALFDDLAGEAFRILRNGESQGSMPGGGGREEQ